MVSVCGAQDLSQRSGERTAALPWSVSPTESVTTGWHYGAYVDVGYIGNLNVPDSHLWRHRATAAHHNELSPNMGLAYVWKDAIVSSRWGMELGFQGGRDSEEFAFWWVRDASRDRMCSDIFIVRMCRILLRSAKG